MGEHETKEEVGEIISCDCVEWREAGLFPYRAPKRRFGYCPWCGKELEKRKTRIAICRSCGEEVEVSRPSLWPAWCGKCGRSLPAVMKEHNG